MKGLIKKLLPCILIFTILINFNLSCNVYATDDSMTEEGTENLLVEAGGAIGTVIDGIVGILTIFLRAIVVGIAGAVQGVLTAIASAGGSSMVRLADPR